jgi:ATP adenylyltransferase
MIAADLTLKPGTLRPAVARAGRRALASGAQRPIETHKTYIEDGGVRFVVRVVSSLAHKEAVRSAPANPFLPYEPDLFVADISDTHLCLLNKFNVIEQHLLIVTRAFEHQECLLTLADFEALATCLVEYQGLGFYNGGTVAGASQAHKHLQLVPLPLAASGPSIPIEPLLDRARDATGIGTLPGFAFRHAFARLAPAHTGQPPRALAVRAHALYRELLAAAGLHVVEVAGEARQSAPYNLLMTGEWMLLVPRARECFDSISLNALAFAGSLFVKNDAQLELIRRGGPMTVLGAVAFPAE